MPRRNALGGQAAFRLRVVRGPDAGVEITLAADHPTRLLVGQSSVCDLRLTDSAVSRRHLALEMEDAQLRITDLSSRNGTRANGVRIEEAWVGGGALLELGSSAIEVSNKRIGAPMRLSEREHFGELWGASVAMRRLYPLCERLAETDVPVIIEGETGTGKEVLAEALHTEGKRAQGPFVVFDCTAVSGNLIEAELFGHTRGAFTGATQSRDGVFQEAQGGTLLIDEIGDLPLPLQATLLRAVERKEVRPVGLNRSIKLDVRILAATRRSLDEEVQKGRFRDDLFHRLSIARIELPPLRRRRSDVRFLALHFWNVLGGKAEELNEELLARFEDQPWPGNVRELRNVVARKIALGEFAELGADELSEERVAETQLFSLPFDQAKQRALRSFEERYVQHLLDAHKGNVTHAARTAGISRRYLQMIKARKKS